MRVVVTGASGFVGSHTARALAARGHDVVALVRDAAKAARVFPDGRVEIVAGDLLDPAAVRAALSGAEAVVHTAGLVALDERRADEVRRVNVEGTRTVVEAALTVGVARVVHVSSTSVFETRGRPVVGLDAPYATASGAYARSKGDADRFVRALQRDSAPVSITYPSGVHGPDSPELTDGHRATMLWLNSVLRTSSGTTIVDVRDVATAHVALVEGMACARALLGGHFVTWAELGEALRRVTGRRVPVVPFPGPALRGLGRAGDVVKRLVPFGFPLTHEAMSSATRAVPFDSAPTCAALDVAFRSVDETLADEVRWLAAAGHVPAKAAGRLAAPGIPSA